MDGEAHRTAGMVTPTRRRSYLWELRPYARQVRGQLLLGSIGGLTSNVAVALPAVLLGRAIDAVLALDQGRGTRGNVVRAAVLLVAGVVTFEVTKMAKRWWLNNAWAAMKANIRVDAFRGLVAWPLALVLATPTGDVLSRVVGDIEVVGDGFGEVVFETWDTVLQTAMLAAVMVAYDWRLAAYALLPVPVALAVGLAAGRRVARRTTATREASATVTTAIQEYLTGVRVLRLYGWTEGAVSDVSARSRMRADAELAATRLREGLKPLYATMLSAGVVLVVWRGGEAVVAGSMTVGALVAFLQLYLRFVARAPRLPQMLNTIRAGGAAWDRLRPLLAPPVSLGRERRWSSFRSGEVMGAAPGRARRPGDGAGPMGVSVDGVTFAYPGSSRPALIDVSIEIPAGAFVLVTGTVGSGKSALARLLVGVHEPDAGQLQRHGDGPIGYVSQEPSLFSGTLADNVALRWPTAPDHPSVTHALRLAALEDEIVTAPGASLDEGELGARVSGGQRQRIALARALAASWPDHPGLFVLDDPFSAIDVRTQATILARLRKAAVQPGRRATIVICSARLVGLPAADMVIVLDGGRIVERGSHVDLLAAGGLYARIFGLQSREVG